MSSASWVKALLLPVLGEKSSSGIRQQSYLLSVDRKQLGLLYTASFCWTVSTRLVLLLHPEERQGYRPFVSKRNKHRTSLFCYLLSLPLRRKPATLTAFVTVKGSPVPAALASRVGQTRPHTRGPYWRVRTLKHHLIQFVSRLAD